MKTQMWEMFVPLEGTPADRIETWKKEVIKLSGGMTCMPGKVQGIWLRPYHSENDPTESEAMSIFRVACSKKDMKKVALYTRNVFSQYSVMYYRVAKEVRRTVWDEEKRLKKEGVPGTHTGSR